MPDIVIELHKAKNLIGIIGCQISLISDLTIDSITKKKLISNMQDIRKIVMESTLGKELIK